MYFTSDYFDADNKNVVYLSQRSTSVVNDVNDRIITRHSAGAPVTLQKMA
jgi:chromosomal replication initiation ATPase DnaA